MPLNILLVSDYYPPFLGGAQRQTQLLAKSFLRRGHNVSVATLWHPGMQSLEDDEGVAVYRLRQLRTAVSQLARKKGEQHSPPFPDPFISAGVRKIIDQIKPDVIHTYGWISFSVALALVGRQIPLLVSARDYGLSCPTRILLNQGKICSGPAFSKCLQCTPQEFGSTYGFLATLGVRMSRLLLQRKMTALHSISTFVHDVMERDLLARSSKPVIHKIIPSFRESAAPSSQLNLDQYLNRLPQEPFILFTGTLRRVKGIYELLAAYQRLDNPPPLVLLGHITSDAPKSFPPGVFAVGGFPHSAVMETWKRCLFGVTPSQWAEPLGSVVYEAMSMGKAIIGTEPGGHTDMIIDNETGLLVPTGDVESLVKAMRFLLEHPDKCEEFGRVGQERAKQFTDVHTIPQFESIYERLACSDN